MEEKNVLLIAGGGTLGTYTSEELIRLGHNVDVICLEDKNSCNNKLKFYKADATYEFLSEFISKRYYDAIVNFIHYTDVEEYKKIYQLLIKNTAHLVFLSSYRVYADKCCPVTENSPRLTDVLTDKNFLDNENYAVPKSKCEDFLINECVGQSWTVVRPVISFSDKRLDCHVYGGYQILEKARSGEQLILPESSQNLFAGLDWAGNTGKLIARLLFNPDTFGECYTISSAQNLTWKEIADIYSELTGIIIKWVNEDEFNAVLNKMEFYKKWNYLYDRSYNRKIDNTKVLKVTGLNNKDFKSIKEGLQIELSKIKNREEQKI